MPDTDMPVDDTKSPCLIVYCIVTCIYPFFKFLLKAPIWIMHNHPDYVCMLVGLLYNAY